MQSEPTTPTATGLPDKPAAVTGKPEPLPDKLPTVYQAVAKAAALAKVAGTDARNEYDKYDYRSIKGVMNAAHEALATAGVTVILHEMRDFKRELVATSKGGQEVLITYAGIFRVYGPAGDYLELVHFCEGMDRRDKASNKASSAGYKEVLQKLLTLPFGHEESEAASEERDGGVAAPAPERDQRDQQRQRPAKQQDQREPRVAQPARENQRQRPAEQQDQREPQVAPRWTYRLPRGILRYKKETRQFEEIDAGALPLPELRDALVACEKRVSWYAARNEDNPLADARRDAELVRNLIDAREQEIRDDVSGRHAYGDVPGALPGSPGADARTDAVRKALFEINRSQEPTTEPEPPATEIQPAPAEPEPEPEPAEARGDLSVSTKPVHLGDETKVPTAAALEEAERNALLNMPAPAINAMALARANAPLFNPEAMAAVRAVTHNWAVATGREPPTPLTGAWLAGPWLDSHEANKATRRDARRLCRLALASGEAPHRQASVKETAALVNLALMATPEPRKDVQP